jgi:anti-sigma factor ChrR (cupin superfamily)
MTANPLQAQERRISVYDFAQMPWKTAGQAGLSMKIVRRDDEKGHFLGLLAFDSLARSGLHQHLGTAISYFLSGGLTDYAGTAVAGQAGINLKGATHDAIAYQPSLLVARLEAPVIYPQSTTHRLHAGARHADIVNALPNVPPDINITVAQLPHDATHVEGLKRRVVFDYSATEDKRRFAELSLRPGAAIPMHRTSAPVEWFVLAGDVTLNDVDAHSGCCVVIEPDTELRVSSRYGCMLLAWADAPVQWMDGAPRPELYGFWSASHWLNAAASAPSAAFAKADRSC